MVIELAIRLGIALGEENIREIRKIEVHFN